MGLFDRLFGKEAEPARADRRNDHDNASSGSAEIEGPPQLVAAIQRHQAYWTHDAQEQARLQSRGIEQLDWRELLRLYHLLCLERARAEPDDDEATDSPILPVGESLQQTIRRLIAPDSPYRPRPALIWQGNTAQPGNDREPNLQGELTNASLTHLGCLEVFRTNEKLHPASLDFVSFDELSGVMLASPGMLRGAKLFYDDGREEIVLLPLLYGLTWKLGNEYDRAGRMTRFVGHVHDEELGMIGSFGIGLGQQDLAIHTEAGGQHLFGLGSVAEISFPLDMRDPRFDAKARARGLDPDQIRAQVEGR